MLITSHHVVSPSRAEGFNTFVYPHDGQGPWDPVRGLDHHAAQPVSQVVQIPPGGNHVRSFLDVSVQDGLARQSVYDFLGKLPELVETSSLTAKKAGSLFPITIRVGNGFAALRFGIDLGLSEQWLDELEELTTQAQAAALATPMLPSSSPLHSTGALSPMETAVVADAARGANTALLVSLLRELARVGRVQAMHTAIVSYSSQRVQHGPATQEFLFSLIPGILTNNFFPQLGSARFESFIAWSMQNRGWADDLIRAAQASAKRLEHHVNSIVAQL